LKCRCMMPLRSFRGRRERNEAFSSPIKAADRAVIHSIWWLGRTQTRAAAKIKLGLGVETGQY